MLTGLEALLEAVEVGRAAGNAVDAHLVDAAPLDFTDARAYYERDVALLSSAIISNMVKYLKEVTNRQLDYSIM